MTIPFNRPYINVKELEYIATAQAAGMLAGDGFFTSRCHCWLEDRTGAARAFRIHSGTAALEMKAILMDLKFGDEAIMPSLAFPCPLFDALIEMPDSGRRQNRNGTAVLFDHEWQLAMCQHLYDA